MGGHDYGRLEWSRDRYTAHARGIPSSWERCVFTAILRVCPLFGAILGLYQACQIFFATQFHKIQCVSMNMQQTRHLRMNNCNFGEFLKKSFSCALSAESYRTREFPARNFT